MGFYIRKSFGKGPIRLNLSKSGLGISVGVKGARVSFGPRGTFLHAGRGGAGKTALALEVAGRLYQSFHGAVWFVPLADTADPQLMGEAILTAIYLPRPPEKEPLEQVAAALSGQRTLLILDSFEHLENEGAAMVRTLLEEVEALTVLVTSRQRLCLPGEHEVPVRPLPTPSGPCLPDRLLRYESVRLFVDRAQAVRPDFQVTAANAAAVAELCRRLEGLPLALELAAARAGVLTPVQMLDRLGQRFELLVSRGRERVPRHRSLRAALDWSYQLLSPELQWFFVQLSSFRGGWTLEAAEAVCDEGVGRVPAERAGTREAGGGLGVGETGSDPTLDTQPPTPALDHLTQLQGCGLVLSKGRGEEMRFRLLETLREYAAEQLTAEQRAELARCHAAYYLALAERAEPELRGPDQRAWLGRLETEHANLRAALDWAVESGATEWGLRLAGALWPFWGVRGYWPEGRERLGRLMDLTRGARSEGETREPPERTAAQARALHGAGVLAHLQGDLKAARLSLEESLAIWRERDDPWGIARTLDSLGWVARDQGSWGAARALCDEGLDLSWKLGDDRGIAFWLHILGDVARARGDEDAARALYQESLSILVPLGDRQSIGVSLNYLGNLALDQGDVDAGRALLEESLTVSRELGDKCGIARSLYHLGKMALNQGGWRAAFSLYAESLAIRRQLGNKQSIAECLEDLGAVYGRQEQPERAAKLFGAAEALRDAMISSPFPSNAAGANLREIAFTAVHGGPLAGPGKARMMTVEQLITEALAVETPPSSQTAVGVAATVPGHRAAGGRSGQRRPVPVRRCGS